MVADNATNGFMNHLSGWNNEFDTRCVFKTLSNIYDRPFAKIVNGYMTVRLVG